VTSHYYTAAEDVNWDYAPGKMDLLYGQGISQPWFAQTIGPTIGGQTRRHPLGCVARI
jgi:hypothetical protein